MAAFKEMYERQTAKISDKLAKLENYLAGVTPDL